MSTSNICRLQDGQKIKISAGYESNRNQTQKDQDNAGRFIRATENQTQKDQDNKVIAGRFIRATENQTQKDQDNKVIAGRFLEALEKNGTW